MVLKPTARVASLARQLPRKLGAATTEIAPLLIHGKCHCGNISFSLTWEPDPAEIPVRACTCSFCTKHGGAWTSNPGGALKVVVTSRIDGHLYAVVSVNAFEGIDQSLLRRASTSFDGEGQESRLARRKRSWIANVEYVESRA